MRKEEEGLAAFLRRHSSDARVTTAEEPKYSGLRDLRLKVSNKSVQAVPRWRFWLEAVLTGCSGGGREGAGNPTPYVV